VKKRKLRTITPFKVFEIGTNRKCIIELFSLGRTAEELRTNNSWEQSHGLFATAKRLTLVSELVYVTTHFDIPSSPRFVAYFLQAKYDFYMENDRFMFLVTLWSLRDNVR